jgi:WD40 repeat protein
LLQTFAGLKTIFLENVPVTATYNDSLRTFVVASKKIATVKCQPRLNLNKTDGYTDRSKISIILLNELFNFLVTCSVDSTIIIWDVCKGRKVNMITEAHTRTIQGVVKHVEITAGCFDSKHQFLLTAGDDGTLKVWNFNEGICLRNIDIEKRTRISSVFWTGHRIFVMQDKTITEFPDSNNYSDNNNSRVWRELHCGKIVCSSIFQPHAIVTACSCGDLIFWQLETGQPYMRFNVQHPAKHLQLVHNKNSLEMKSLPVAKNHEVVADSKSNKMLTALGERLNVNFNMECKQLLFTFLRPL